MAFERPVTRCYEESVSALIGPDTFLKVLHFIGAAAGRLSQSASLSHGGRVGRVVSQ
jgi:hypothetical protein